MTHAGIEAAEAMMREAFMEALEREKTVAHTPGPWKAEYDESGGYDCMSSAYHIRESKEQFGRLASVDVGDYLPKGWNEDWDTRHSKHPQAEANARLMAAAPDLLAMCESVLSLLDGDHDGSQQYEDMCGYQAEQIRDAIKKARGL